MNEGISVADALALRNTGNGNNDGFGGDGWWVILLVLFAMGGFGRGFGGFGGAGGDGGFSPCCAPATAQGMADAFNFNQLDNGIRGIQNGLCDGFYAQNNAINGVLSAIQNCCCQTQLGMTQGFHGVDNAICTLGYNIQQGFNGVDKSICNLGYQNQAGFNGLATQLASCCCDIERGQDAIKYDMAANTNALLVANDKNTDRIINYLTQTEMDKLRTELQSAQFQLSQLSQTSNIVNQLMPVAKPAYLTCSPYAAAFGFAGQCGCGCGCA
jgi:hypothetical protein